MRKWYRTSQCLYSPREEIDLDELGEVTAFEQSVLSFYSPGTQAIRGDKWAEFVDRVLSKEQKDVIASLRQERWHRLDDLARSMAAAILVQTFLLTEEQAKQAMEAVGPVDVKVMAGVRYDHYAIFFRQVNRYVSLATVKLFEAYSQKETSELQISLTMTQRRLVESKIAIIGADDLDRKCPLAQAAAAQEHWFALQARNELENLQKLFPGEGIGDNVLNDVEAEVHALATKIANHRIDRVGELQELTFLPEQEPRSFDHLVECDSDILKFLDWQISENRNETRWICDHEEWKQIIERVLTPGQQQRRADLVGQRAKMNVTLVSEILVAIVDQDQLFSLEQREAVMELVDKTLQDRRMFAKRVSDINSEEWAQFLDAMARVQHEKLESTLLPHQQKLWNLMVKKIRSIDRTAWRKCIGRFKI